MSNGIESAGTPDPVRDWELAFEMPDTGTRVFVSVTCGREESGKIGREAIEMARRLGALVL
jgi:hypothetical protein